MSWNASQKTQFDLELSIATDLMERRREKRKKETVIKTDFPK